MADTTPSAPRPPPRAVAACAPPPDALTTAYVVFGRSHANASDVPSTHAAAALYLVTDLTPVALAADHRTPHGHAQAMKLNGDVWWASELKELDAHRRNGSWILADRTNRQLVPADANIVNLLWVYKWKLDGSAKSRLCVDGSGQRYGIDFDQTHASTIRTSTLRCFAGIQSALKLRSRRKDLVSAYLQGDLEPGEVLYARMPPGHELIGADGKPRVCIIQKPIYGMKQAGRRLQRKLFPWLRSWGGGILEQLYSDSCVFVGRDGDDILLIGIFVDDATILYRHDGPTSLYARFSADFHREWEAEDEGELADLLNIHWRVSSDTVTIHQGPYIDSLVTRFFPDGMPSLRSNQAPCDDKIYERVLAATVAGQPDCTAEEHARFRSLVGALIYAAISTRPDIAYATGILSRVMHCPTAALLADAERVLAYLHLHRDIGMTYDADMVDPLAYCDSDWAVRRSTSGWCVLWHTAAVSWGSKQQATIALS